MRRGVFITFEGPEGSGKSSQARRLVRWLGQRGYPAVFVRDPGSTSLGRALRRVLLHAPLIAISPLAEALLFIGARVQLVEERIRPALANGRLVVCDRFHDATLAYQGYGGGVDVEWLDRVGRQAIRGVVPQVTLLLDVPTSLGFRRLRRRRRRDRMEEKAAAFHRRVRAGYRRLAARWPKRVILIDASQRPDVVQTHIRRAILRRLNRITP